jgi:O-antigen/teichoic acid export membrane protein
MLALFQSSNFVIINYIGSEEVVKYNVAFNLFSMMNIAFSTIAAPYWSAYANAWHQDDLLWIKKAQKKLLFIWLLIVSVSAVVLVFSDQVYSIWLNDQVEIPFSLSFALFVYMSLFCFGLIFNTFINSTGKILLQTISLTILTVIYIPLVILLIDKLQFGLISIPIALSIVASYTVLIAPWQSRKILSKKASGIFNR